MEQILFLFLVILYLVFIFIYVKKQKHQTTLLQKITNIVVSIFFIYNIFNIYQLNTIFYILEFATTIAIVAVYFESIFNTIKKSKNK